MSFRLVCNITIFAFLTCHAFSATGQTTVDTSGRKKNNIVEVLHRVYWFYDGSPLRAYYPTRLDGFSYTRFVYKRHAISASCDYWGTIFLEDEPFSRSPGDIMQRTTDIYMLNYQLPLLFNHKVHFWINGGGVYRHGSELVHIAYLGKAEALVEGRGYRDWGGNLGCKVTRFLPWNFLISAEASYTHFFYLEHKPGQIVRYPWFYDQGSPPNMSSVGVSLGYRF